MMIKGVQAYQPGKHDPKPGAEGEDQDTPQHPGDDSGPTRATTPTRGPGAKNGTKNPKLNETEVRAQSQAPPNPPR